MNNQATSSAPSNASPPPYPAEKPGSSARDEEKQIIEAWTPFVNLMLSIDGLVATHLVDARHLITTAPITYARFTNTITADFVSQFQSSCKEWEAELSTNPCRASFQRYLTWAGQFDAWSLCFRFKIFYYHLTVKDVPQQGMNAVEVRHLNAYVSMHQKLVLVTAQSKVTDLALENSFGPKLQAYDDFADLATAGDMAFEHAGRAGKRWRDTLKKLQSSRKERNQAGKGDEAWRPRTTKQTKAQSPVEDVKVRKSFQIGRFVFGRRSS